MANKTVTVKPSGGTYTTLAAAIAGEVTANADLTAMDGILNIEIDGDWSSGGDTTAVTVDGFTTDATRYANIYTTATARHSGVWTTAKYRLSVTNAIALTISDNHVRIAGLQIESVAPEGNDRHIVRISSLTSGGNLICLSSNIARGHFHATRTQQGFKIDGDYVNTKTWNNIIYLEALANNLAVNFSAGGGTSHQIYSTTVIGGAYGFYRGTGTITAKNCYAGGSLTSDYSGTITKTTCASSDATGDVGLQSVAVNTTNFTNVTAGSQNFHVPSGSALIDVGTNTSGDADPLNFTTDIDGNIRSGTWDIGADEYVAAAGDSTYAYTSQKTFTFSTGDTVYGYYLTSRNSDGDTILIGAKRFTSAPLIFPSSGGTLKVSPKIKLE